MKKRPGQLKRIPSAKQIRERLDRLLVECDQLRILLRVAEELEQVEKLSMKTYHFKAILSGVSEVNDEIAEALYEAGCDDGSPGSRDGVVFVHFDRKAETLEAAILSAVANIRAAGLSTQRVEVPTEGKHPMVLTGGPNLAVPSKPENNGHSDPERPAND